jgi:hypothetical protein
MLEATHSFVQLHDNLRELVLGLELARRAVQLEDDWWTLVMSSFTLPLFRTYVQMRLLAIGDSYERSNPLTALFEQILEQLQYRAVAYFCGSGMDEPVDFAGQSVLFEFAIQRLLAMLIVEEAQEPEEPVSEVADTETPDNVRSCWFCCCCFVCEWRSAAVVVPVSRSQEQLVQFVENQLVALDRVTADLTRSPPTAADIKKFSLFALHTHSLIRAAIMLTPEAEQAAADRRFASVFKACSRPKLRLEPLMAAVNVAGLSLRPDLIYQP